MNAYSQLSDAELVRKVQELMGYSVRYHGFGWDNNPATYNLYNGDILFFSAITEDSAWSYAPSPMTDANVTMRLVDEMVAMGLDFDLCYELSRETGVGRAKVWKCFVTHWRSRKNKNDFWCVNNAINKENEAWNTTMTKERAICEVYCVVKEGQK